MSYANDMPTADLRTDTGLASELRAGVMRLRRRLISERHPDNDLSISQMVVLGLLVRTGEQTVGDLARAERVQPPSMTRLLASLEGLGLVVRTGHPTDGRQVLLTASEAGVALLREDRRRREAWLAQRLAELDAEDREVLRRAAAVLDRLAGS